MPLSARARPDGVRRGIVTRQGGDPPWRGSGRPAGPTRARFRPQGGTPPSPPLQHLRQPDQPHRNHHRRRAPNLPTRHIPADRPVRGRLGRSARGLDRPGVARQSRLPDRRRASTAGRRAGRVCRDGRAGRHPGVVDARPTGGRAGCGSSGSRMVLRAARRPVALARRRQFAQVQAQPLAQAKSRYRTGPIAGARPSPGVKRSANALRV